MQVLVLDSNSQEAKFYISKIGKMYSASFTFQDEIIVYKKDNLEGLLAISGIKRCSRAMKTNGFPPELQDKLPGNINDGDLLPEIFMWVEPGARNKGVGYQVLEDTLNRCLDKGYGIVKTYLYNIAMKKMVDKLPAHLKKIALTIDLSNVLGEIDVKEVKENQIGEFQVVGVSEAQKYIKQIKLSYVLPILTSGSADEWVIQVREGKLIAIAAIYPRGEYITYTDEEIQEKIANGIYYPPNHFENTHLPSINGFWVEKSYRGQGIGTALVKATIDRCSERNLGLLRLELISDRMRKIINSLPPDYLGKLMMFDWQNSVEVLLRWEK